MKGFTVVAPLSKARARRALDDTFRALRYVPSWTDDSFGTARRGTTVRFFLLDVLSPRNLVEFTIDGDDRGSEITMKKLSMGFLIAGGTGWLAVNSMMRRLRDTLVETLTSRSGTDGLEVTTF